MNMFKPVKAASIKEYFAQLVPERRAALEFLDDIIKKTVPELKPHFAYNMLGYGSFPYKNYKKEQGEWPVVSLASQKQYISLYVCALEDGAYLAEKYQKDLGKVSVGKSCIRFKKIEDLDVSGLKKLLRLAARMPGLVRAEEWRAGKKK